MFFHVIFIQMLFFIILFSISTDVMCLGREGNNMARAIKEAIYIRVNNPSLNRNMGKYNLPHIWDRVLYSLPELKISK